MWPYPDYAELYIVGASPYNAIATIAVDSGVVLSILFAFELVLLLVAARGFRWMQVRSPYHRFAYRDAGMALQIIRKGLVRDPNSFLLGRRLAVYSIAAGHYGEAVAGLERCLKVKDDDLALGAFLGVALMGAGADAAGTEALRAAADQLPERRLAALERELAFCLNSGAEPRTRCPAYGPAC